MKTCSKCGHEKPRSEFYGDASKRDGLCSHCKACLAARRALNRERESARTRAWYAANRDRARATNKAWREANKGKIKANDKARYEKNLEQVLATVKAYRTVNSEKVKLAKRAWQAANLDKCRANNARRHAAKLRAMPAWGDPQKIEIEYQLAAWCTKVMGTPYQVDHIVPLQGKTVCGLHVEHNLRVVLAKENFSKGNRHWPGMWSRERKTPKKEATK